ncbi:hypothetical protein [Sporosarcina sp. FSL K6-1508]|uniref:hypothetical protein n=1 Tax=Sporosarcina sp. FSL K6-1508 TaxID=2921553 RepID=UPI0030F928A3
MNFLIDYWFIILVLIVLLAFAAYAVFQFFKAPSNEQLIKVKEWLLFAVIQAEKELGEGTGKIKLRYVYDLFVTKFKWLSYLIKFDHFSRLVDEALEEMRHLLSSNRAVHNYVEGEDKHVY